MYFLLVMIIGHIALLTSGAEDVTLKSLCFPEEYTNNNSALKVCDCTSASEPDLGIKSLRIDCSFQDLRSKSFKGGALPLYITSLDLSWNKLEFIANFESDSLRILNVMHNNVSTLYENNFRELTMLRELYLAWNAIQIISMNAFSGLQYLQVLDLSHNNLKQLSLNVFSSLRTLDTLSLSWNRHLNNTDGIQELDFYAQFGVQPKLRALKLESCGISNIYLPQNAPLEALSLRNNLFESVPNKLPTGLSEFDISGNPIPSLLENHTAQLVELKVLLIEDMPLLRSVEYNSLSHLSKLKALSFENSRRLVSFHEFAFGTNSTNIDLDVLSLRGTAMRTLNQTLLPIFQQLMELDLNGMPLRCDCELIWVKELKIETNGRCISPSSLRGMKLKNVCTKDFSCDRWPRWVYGVLILLLIILCAAGICLIVMGLRPNRGVTMRRKIGSNSPYARVTIEPNNQEPRYF